MYYKAALEFERATGIPDIGYRYTFPPRTTAESIEDAVAEIGVRYSFGQWSHKRRFLGQEVTLEEMCPEAGCYEQARTDMAFLRAHIAAIVELNPALEHLNFNPDCFIDLYDVLYGIVSGYHPDDIEFFLHDGGNTFESDAYRNSVREVDGTLRARFAPKAQTTLIPWLPAPSTVEKMRAACQCLDV